MYTLTSSPNCKVKEVNLNHEGSFDLDVSQQQKHYGDFKSLILLLRWKT